MKRKKIVAANWKMNLTLSKAIELSGDIKRDVTGANCEIILFPSFLYLNEVKEALETSTIKIGAQNCCHFEDGAYTGEVSAHQLSSEGIEYVIVGHSERREKFGETDGMLREKIKLATKHKLKPVFCCGEPLQVRIENRQASYVLRQLEEGLFFLSADEIGSVIIAYEPVWAIGTGRNASAGQAQEMHAYIRSLISKKYSGEVAQQIGIIYGGSCNPGNAKEIFSCPDVDGGLIGTASLNAQDFLSIIDSAEISGV